MGRLVPRRAAPWHHVPVRMVLDVLFDLTLEHGRCVGVRLPPEGTALDALADGLHAGERELAAGLATRRRRTWVGGRAALREALTRAGLEAPGPVLGDDR